MPGAKAGDPLLNNFSHTREASQLKLYAEYPPANVHQPQSAEQKPLANLDDLVPPHRKMCAASALERDVSCPDLNVLVPPSPGAQGTPPERAEHEYRADGGF